MYTYSLGQRLATCFFAGAATITTKPKKTTPPIYFNAPP